MWHRFQCIRKNRAITWKERTLGIALIAEEWVRVANSGLTLNMQKKLSPWKKEAYPKKSEEGKQQKVFWEGENLACSLHHGRGEYLLRCASEDGLVPVGIPLLSLFWVWIDRLLGKDGKGNTAGEDREISASWFSWFFAPTFNLPSVLDAKYPCKEKMRKNLPPSCGPFGTSWPWGTPNSKMEALAGIPVTKGMEGYVRRIVESFWSVTVEVTSRVLHMLFTTNQSYVYHGLCFSVTGDVLPLVTNAGV